MEMPTKNQDALARAGDRLGQLLSTAGDSWEQGDDVPPLGACRPAAHWSPSVVRKSTSTRAPGSLGDRRAVCRSTRSSTR